MFIRPLFAALFLLGVASAHDLVVTPQPKIIQDGRAISGLRAIGPHSMDVFRLTVPPGSTSLQVTTTGRYGELQLYLRRGAHPASDGSIFDYSSTNTGSREQINVTNPEPGTWYVGLLTHADPYIGVRLQVRTRHARGSLPLPRFMPNPGVFSGKADIRMIGGFGGKAYYTTDGSDPDASSPIAPRTLTITEDTTIKARIIDRRGNVGPIAEATYIVKPAEQVVDISGANAATHLAGSRGDRHLFKISVPAGKRLMIQAEDGSGGSTISANFGSVPPPGLRRGGASFFYGSRKIEIANTTAGDYYISLEARGNFSDRSVFATLTTDSPDLMPWGASLRPYVSTETFSPTSCEVQEGLIGPGERRLLRYSTEVRNVGKKDLVMESPEGNPLFEYHACHGHYHFAGFASSRILDLAGNVLREGNKVSFCLLDGKRWDRKAPSRSLYTCAKQGIQAGWSDIYDSGLPGQWVEIDNLPPGNYQLELTVNPDGLLPEENRDNNKVRIPVRIR